MIKWRKFSSDEKTVSGVIYSGPCYYFGFSVSPGGTDRTIVVYNALSATGTKVEVTWTADGTKKMDGHEHASPVYCDTGIYLSTSGTGEKVVVYYLPANFAAKDLPRIKENVMAKPLTGDPTGSSLRSEEKKARHVLRGYSLIQDDTMEDIEKLGGLNETPLSLSLQGMTDVNLTMYNLGKQDLARKIRFLWEQGKRPAEERQEKAEEVE